MNLAGPCQICFPQRRTRIIYNNLTLPGLSTLKGLFLPENLTESDPENSGLSAFSVSGIKIVIE